MFSDAVKLYLKNFVDIFIICLLGAAFLVLITIKHNTTWYAYLGLPICWALTYMPFLMIAYMASLNSIRRLGFINLYKHIKTNFVTILLASGLLLITDVLFATASFFEKALIKTHFDLHKYDMLNFLKALHEKGDFSYYLIILTTIIIAHFFAFIKASGALFCFIIFFKTLFTKSSLREVFKNAIECVKDHKKGFIISAIGIAFSSQLIPLIITLISFIFYWISDPGTPFLVWFSKTWMTLFADIGLTIMNYLNMSVGTFFAMLVILPTAFPKISWLFYIFFTLKFLKKESSHDQRQ